MHKTIIIGLGNTLMTDDGIGVHVVRRLAETAEPRPDIELVEGGTAGMKLMYLWEGFQSAVLIDAALMGEEPGTIRRFRPEDVKAGIVVSGFSLHEGDLLSVLDLSRRLGNCPAEVTLFGVQPAEVGPGLKPTALLAARIGDYAALVRQFLGDEDVTTDG